MPWIGNQFVRDNGTYQGSDVWQNDRDANYEIDADRHDAHDEDMAQAINQTLPRNGSVPMEGDLDLGGYTITNFTKGQTASDIASLGQTITNVTYANGQITLERDSEPNFVVDLGDGVGQAALSAEAAQQSAEQAASYVQLRSFASVEDLKTSNLQGNKQVVATKSYYDEGTGYYGDGAAKYMIWTLADYRNEIGDQGWLPDGYAHLTLANGNVAIRQGKLQPRVAIVQDDSYESGHTVFAPLLTSRGHLGNFAIATNTLNVATKLTSLQLTELAKQGHEIINHSYSGNTQTDSVPIANVRGEILTCQQTLEGLGIKPVGYQTPSSSLGATHLPTVRGLFSYAFTVGYSGTIAQDIEDKFKLRRVSIESNTEADLVEGLTNAILMDKPIVYYLHDLAVADANYAKVEALLDRLELLGGVATTCSEALSVAPSNRGELRSLKTLTANRDFWGATVGTKTVDGNNDIRITYSGAVLDLFQKSTYINLEEMHNALTFSTAFRLLSGSIGTAGKIGIKVTDTSTSTVVYQNEERADPTNGYARLCKSFDLQAGDYLILTYLRIDMASAGEVLVRDPIITLGTGVLATPKLETNRIFSKAIPTQTLTAGTYTTSQTVALTPDTNDDRVYLTSDRIVFTGHHRVHISYELGCFGASVLSGSTGGVMFLDYGYGYETASLPIGSSGGTNAVSATLTVTPETQIRLAAAPFGVDFPVNSAYSKVIIRFLDY